MASSLTTAFPALASKAESDAESIADDVIEAILPKNFSIGTKQFCVGFSNRSECHNWPLNISDIIPQNIANFSHEVQALQPLEGILAKMTSTNIQDVLISSLAFIVVAVLVCAILIELEKSFFKLVVGLGAGLLCLAFVLGLVPTIILHDMQSKIRDLGPIIGIVMGDVWETVVVVLVCVILMILLVVSLLL